MVEQQSHRFAVVALDRRSDQVVHGALHHAMQQLEVFDDGCPSVRAAVSQHFVLAAREKRHQLSQEDCSQVAPLVILGGHGGRHGKEGQTQLGGDDTAPGGVHGCRRHDFLQQDPQHPIVAHDGGAEDAPRGQLLDDLDEAPDDVLVAVADGQLQELPVDVLVAFQTRQKQIVLNYGLRDALNPFGHVLPW